MKKILTAAVMLLLCTAAFAKTVKFSVDMTGNTISSKGMHVEGDFQTAAGYPGGDFLSSSTSLIREGSTDIYSVTVNVPAFKAYQFKYVNGNQFYDVEFVPAESRVHSLLNDNRWIYVDSLNADTMKLAVVQYGMNAPAGLILLRFKVDMRNALPTAGTGAHVAGLFQGSNPATTRLYSFADSVYEYITYVTAGTYDYKYYSGNTAATAETVPSACAVSGNRSVTVNSDIVLNAICFSSCSACSGLTTGMTAVVEPVKAEIVPNPVQDYLNIRFQDKLGMHNVTLTDAAGHLVRSIAATKDAQVRISREGLSTGLYFLKITASGGSVFNSKVCIQ